MVEINKINIRDIACCIPQNKINNTDVAGFDLERKQKIADSIGVKTRHISEQTQCTSDFCFEAASYMIKSSGIDISQIGVLVLATQSPDYILPATSCILQNRLGLSQDTIAFDINLGCSAYVYGLYIVSSLLLSSGKKYGLLLAGDTISKYVSPDDASTCFLFGDAGSATLLERVEDCESMIYSLGTDGSGWSNLIIPVGATRNKHSDVTNELKVDREGNSRSEENLFMDGMEIFNFTISTVAPHIESLLRSNERIDAVILHQANKYMLEFLRKSLKIPTDKFMYSLENYGNTSSASIPLTLCTCSEPIEKFQRLLLSGFGVGYSWGSVIVSLTNTSIHKIIYI